MEKIVKMRLEEKHARQKMDEEKFGYWELSNILLGAVKNEVKIWKI